MEKTGRFETIIYKQEEGIAEIIINRPEKMNAISFKVVAEFSEALEQVAGDENAHVLIVSGAGEKAFSAGDDVRDPDWVEGAANMTPGDLYPWMRQKHFWHLLEEIRNLRKPVIAAVQGWCLGSAPDLAMACDIIIASETAKIGMPFIKIGVVTGASQLARVVGYHKACELLFTGTPIDAKEAENIGLVNRVVPADQLESTVRQLAEQLAQEATPLIGWTKWALNKSLSATFAEALDYELAAMTMTHPSKYIPRLVERQGGLIYSEKK